ncbi:MAG: Ig-like domain-containing protein [Myxococcaceae bacterium]
MNSFRRVVLAALFAASFSSCIVGTSGARCETDANCPADQHCAADFQCAPGAPSTGGGGGTTGGGSGGGSTVGGGGGADGGGGGTTGGGGGTTGGGGGTTGGGGGTTGGGGGTTGGGGGTTGGGGGTTGGGGGTTGGGGGTTGGGGGATGGGGGMVDTTPPEVQVTTPVGGSTNVSINTTVQIVFSEPMDIASVLYLSTITFNAPVWSAGNTTLTLTPTSALAFSTNYSFTITGKDVAQNSMTAYAFSFTTGAAPDTTRPTMTQTQPANAATNVPTTTSLILTFSEPMNPTSVTVNLNPPVTLGAGAWANNNTELTIGPTAALAANTNYVVSVGGADPSGNTLMGTISFNFVTAPPPDTTAPTLVSSLPADGTMNIASDTTPQLVFSEPMNPATLDVQFTPGWDPGTPVWSNGNRTVDFPMPAAKLQADTAYAWTINATDVAGNPLAPTTLGFRTAVPPDTTPPTVVSTSPNNLATGIPQNTVIEVSFSEPMNKAVTEAAFSTNPAVTCTSFTWNAQGTLLDCNHAAQLTASTSYTVTINNGAKDLAGNNMAAPYQFSFTTAAAPDTTPPTVSSTNPVNNAIGVPRSTGLFRNNPTTISITFSEAMNNSSVQGAFSITSPTGFNGGTFSWNNRTVTYTPPAYFPYGQVVTFQIGTGATDLAGNHLAATYTSSFRVKRIAQNVYFYLSGTTNSGGTSALDGYMFGDNACSSSTAVNAGVSYVVGGHSGANVYRGFLTFDISALSSLGHVDFTSARLYAQQLACSGNPFAVGFGSAIEAWHVSYGSSLTVGDCATANILGLQSSLSTNTTLGLKSASVTGMLQDDWDNRLTYGNRAQFEIRTHTMVTASGVDYCTFGDFNQSGTANDPYLLVTYEYD